METELLLIIIGVIVGWLTSVMTRGSLAAMAANIVIGVCGSFFSYWLIERFNLLAADASLFFVIVIAAIGACMLLSFMRMLRLA